VFGAGATKACGGPLTNEILPDALALKRRLERAGDIALVERLLGQNFRLPAPSKRRAAQPPPPHPRAPLHPPPSAQPGPAATPAPAPRAQPRRHRARPRRPARGGVRAG